MDLALPLSADALPGSIRRFGSPDAKGPARTMAAKGLVPVKGSDLVTLLTQLSADSDASVAESARETLGSIPVGVVVTAAAVPAMHPAILHRLAEAFGHSDDVLEAIASNHTSADETIERMARAASDAISEVIATNQQRLLAAPAIIEALYKNENTRMSTADRLIELAARNGVELRAIPAFKAHVEAIRGQLIPEPSDEPLPSDEAFTKVMAEDEDDLNAIEIDEENDTETLKKKFGSLRDQIAGMSTSERIRLAMLGSAAARSILVRHPNKQVAFAAISSPKMSDSEAAGIAHSKEVGDEILRYIANRREWLRGYEIKHALVFNPKTPVGISMKFLSHIRDNDLKTLTRSRGIPNALKTAAKNRMEMKSKGRKS